MKPEEYEVMYRVEDAHWWYRGMEAITRAVLDRVIGRGHNLRILDAGCGTGAAMGYLSDYGAVTGFDFAAEALHFCQVRRRERLSRASVMALPYADAAFNLITSFDVLCERAVIDDGVALREFARVLRPGGRVLLRLPAYNWLRGQHDEAVYIRHRYTTRELRAKLRRAGFAPEVISYANMLLFPVAALKRVSERFLPNRQNGSDLTLGAGSLNTPLGWILSREAPFVARTGLPFGLTVVALGRKATDGNEQTAVGIISR
ncbi:MAG TPA: class I SAM-dependent methyltransferase [Anaerolineae bacterium]|nr:class I SAM-dependent methyltransferase [Anaerolineae bacterium]